MKIKEIIFLAFALVSLTSCGAYKRLGYLQDMDTSRTYDVAQNPESRICRGDILGIEVMSSQPLLAAPFNIRPETSVRDSSYSSGKLLTPQYTVDSKGRINFPILGSIFVEGLTLNELSSQLAEEIRATNYLRDPMVSVAFCNFKITVLGEFKNPGIYDIPTGSINIFELTAMAGDLTEDAQRENLWVIRTNGGTRKMFALNTKSLDVYNSPAFYLQQNDMVYALPRDQKMDKSTSNVITWLTTPLALLSTVFSGLTLLRAYSR